MQAELRRLIDQRERGAIVERHRIGQAVHGRRRCVGELGVAAAREPAAVEERSHAIALLEGRGRRCALDLAADLHARNERKLWLGLIGAGDHERVEVVDRRRAYRDAHHPDSRRARIDAFELHGLGPAEAADDPGLHRGKATAGGKSRAVNRYTVWWRLRSMLGATLAGFGWPRHRLWRWTGYA